MDPLFSLTDKVVVVTGALGRLGRSYCAALRERGAFVAAIDRTVEDDSETMHHFAADVTCRAELECALTKIQAAWGRPIVGLVNNAGLDSPPNSPASENGPFEEYPEESWDRVMDVNVKGVFLSCQVFGGAMAQAGGGSIVNVSSIYGQVSPVQSLYEYRRKRGEEFFKPVAYAASKSALYNLTRYVATYWARKNVRVNTLTLAGVFDNQDVEFLDGYCQRMPMGRMANASDYTGPLVFLLSEASCYMTGADLVVDGGWTAW